MFTTPKNKKDICSRSKTDAYPAEPEDGYGWVKFIERMCRHFTEDFGLPTKLLRYHNVYDIRNLDGGREKAPAVLRKLEC